MSLWYIAAWCCLAAGIVLDLITYRNADRNQIGTWMGAISLVSCTLLGGGAAIACFVIGFIVKHL